MSDTSSTALDPKRPWLTDERELPGHMNWAEVLFNPTGKSPRLHFTRAWTLLFMLQLLVIVLPYSIALVINMAGGDGSSIGMFGVYATPVVFIVTTMMSYVIHARRLADARKSTLLALIPLIPLVLAMFVFMGQVAQQSAQYDKQFETRQEYLKDPDAFRAKQRAEQQKAKEVAEAAAAESGAEEGAAAPQARQQRSGPGGPGGPGQSLDTPMPPKAPTVLKAALPVIQTIIVLLSSLVAIWSLMWVARVPFFGRYPAQEG